MADSTLGSTMVDHTTIVHITTTIHIDHTITETFTTHIDHIIIIGSDYEMADS